MCWFIPYMSPPSWASHPPASPSHLSRLSQSIEFELPASNIKFPMAIYFIYDIIYISMLLSQFVPLSSSSTVFKSLFSMSASPLWRTIWRFLKKKSRNKTTIQPNNPTTGHMPWENHNWKRYAYPNVHCSTIYNS